MNSSVNAAYIHVPFCIHRCGYCDFTVITDRDDLLSVYLDCLESEISSVLSEQQPVETLFIGGGTPNYLPAPHLERLLSLLHKWLPLKQGGEFSIECNPEDFSSDRMDVLAKFGVNRVSLGIQSFQAEHLKTLERRHDPETVTDVVQRLRERGFENVSFDLIFAVPGQSLADWETTLERAIQLTPEHLSTYGLTFEKGTSFWTRRLKQKIKPADEELERSMYAAAMQTLSQAGFEQYELSNHTRPEFLCQHNQVYWNAEQYFGFGPGAASFLSGERAMRYRSVTGWIKHVQAGESPIAERETLTLELSRREAVMLGLRQIKGIALAAFEKRYECKLRDLAPDAYDAFLQSELLEEKQGHLRLTYEGRFLADTVVAEFL